jgi:hypothetical protein
MMRAQYSGDVLNNRVANELKKRGFIISPAGVRRCHAAGAQRRPRCVLEGVGPFWNFAADRCVLGVGRRDPTRLAQ